MKYIRLRSIIFLGLLVAVVATRIGAQEQNTEVEDKDAPAPEVERIGPEFRVRTHPADTFKPSEAVSEDFPVAFPVDI